MKIIHASFFLSLLFHGFLMAIPVTKLEKQIEINTPIRLLYLPPPAVGQAEENVVKERSPLLPADSTPMTPTLTKPEEVIQPVESPSLFSEEKPFQEKAPINHIAEEESFPTEVAVPLQREIVSEDLPILPLDKKFPDAATGSFDFPKSLVETKMVEPMSDAAKESAFEKGKYQVSLPFPSQAMEGVKEPSVSLNAPSIPDKEVLWLDYLTRLRERVEASKVYPPQALRMGLEGKVIVRFVINGSGRIERVELAEASPFPLLNRAAMETIRSLPSLPSLPPALGDRLEVTIPLVYRLEHT